MTIRYAATRTDMIRGYVRAWQHAPTFRWRMMSFALVFAALDLATSHNVARAAIFGVALPVFIPVWFVIRAKTDERILELNNDGIHTAIGRRTGDIPWRSIAGMSDAGDYVIVVRKNGNVFFIPERAFQGDITKAMFVAALSSRLVQVRA